ncbi:MAG: hypothetical protein K9N23_04095 [Akkermansiaceae bacterium]|nr:hypothetical protein [Akkermansiaceae bacterium]MCF7730840.1 hypothetical protein [Akkermansiaceae bacterium]
MNPLEIHLVGSQIQLTWEGAYLRPYQLEVSPDLLTWAEIGPFYVGEAAPLGYTNTNTVPRLFYRLREGAMRPGFDDVEFGRNDDKTYPDSDDNPAPVEWVDIGFDVHYYGTTYSQCYVNNNGNITFDGALPIYTPKPLGSQNAVLISAFWADVDTRHQDSGLTRFSSQPEMADGRQAFGVTWRNVGYFETRMDKTNSFQLLLIDRSDVNTGDFDVEFNYNQIQWETGEASEGVDGLGGLPARVGLADGTGGYIEYAGSGETLAFLDRKPNDNDPNFVQGLIYQMLNSTVPGRLVIPVRNGIPVLPDGYFQIDAGSDIPLGYSGGSSFTLSGSITPANATDVSTVWEQDFSNGAPEAEIVSPNLLTTVVNIPEPGAYAFRLTGTKQGTFGVVSSDLVTITHPSVLVVEGGDYYLPPGSTYQKMLSLAKATWNGANIANVTWTVVTGDGAVIQNPNVIRPTVTLPAPGTYEFEITATTNTSPPFVKKAIATLILAAS